MNDQPTLIYNQMFLKLNSMQKMNAIKIEEIVKLLFFFYSKLFNWNARFYFFVGFFLPCIYLYRIFSMIFLLKSYSRTVVIYLFPRSITSTGSEVVAIWRKSSPNWRRRQLGMALTWEPRKTSPIAFVRSSPNVLMLY